MVRPVHQSTEVIPFVHAANVNAVTHTNGNAIGEIDVVCYQQGLAIADIDNEALMTRVIIVVRQEAADEA